MQYPHSLWLNSFHVYNSTSLLSLTQCPHCVWLEILTVSDSICSLSLTQYPYCLSLNVLTVFHAIPSLIQNTYCLWLNISAIFDSLSSLSGSISTVFTHYLWLAIPNGKDLMFPLSISSLSDSISTVFDPTCSLSLIQYPHCIWLNMPTLTPHPLLGSHCDSAVSH